MPLTPADVHNVAFKKPPIGKRGYDEEEVDAFLDEVERELHLAKPMPVYHPMTLLDCAIRGVRPGPAGVTPVTGGSG